ncbi:unnamed protein product [Linum trigynum]|uniref:Cytochrome P450 n=1 Tax=Linum trigynum TaxID=586398 RepID=A0AAV2GKZ4_9ROSI
MNLIPPFLNAGTLILALVLFLSYYFLFLRIPKSGKGKQVPEAGRSWPVIGHLFSLAGTELPHLKFAALADKYGPIFMVRIGLFPTLVVSTSELAKELFTTHDAAISSRPDLTASTILSNNRADFSFTPYGEYWRQMRKITALELLSSRRIELLKHVRTSEVEGTMKSLYKLWEKSNNRSEGGKDRVRVQMNKVFGDMNLNIMLRMVVGKRYFGTHAAEDDEQREAERCRKLMRDFFRYAGQLVVRDLFPFLGFLDIGGHEKIIKKLHVELDKFAEEWIEEHRSKRRTTSCKDDEQQDFIDVLLSVLKDADLAGYDPDTVCKSTIMVLNGSTPELHTKQKSMLLMDSHPFFPFCCFLWQALIAGGTDTTTGTIIWALSVLLNHPSSLKKVVGNECI